MKNHSRHLYSTLCTLKGMIRRIYVFQGTSCEVYPKGYDVSYPLGYISRKAFFKYVLMSVTRAFPVRNPDIQWSWLSVFCGMDNRPGRLR